MNNLLEQILNAIQNLHWAEIIAVLFAILYLAYAAKEQVICWVFGIISCVFWTYAAFYLYDLYVDALLQLFYIVMSFIGIYQWLYGGAKKQNLEITSLTTKQHILIISVGFMLTGIVGYFFDTYTPAAATYIDSFTTTFSIIATFLVIQKKIDNWIYWFIIDAVYVYLYWIREGYLFSFLFVVYLGIIIFGYFEWKKEVKTAQ